MNYFYNKNGLVKFYTLLLFFSANALLAQNVGINNPTPHASALLDLTSTSQGLLAPRMSSVQRIAIAAPATGLLVYDTNLNSYFIFNGTSWQFLLSGTTTNVANA